MIRRIMPWRAVAPGDVTLITSKQLLAKVISPDGVSDYDDPFWFTVKAVRLEDVEDLAELLARIAGDPYTCIIRGVLRRPLAEHAEVMRRYLDRGGVPAPFAPAARKSLMVDCDGLPAPAGVDPIDPVLAGGALRRSLPPEFHSARAVVQLSGTAGLKPGVVKGHLWFWLNRAISDAEAKRWLKGAPVDDSIYQPVGIHYTAAPLFVGVDNPCLEGRLALLPGYDEVAVPDLPEPDRPRTTFAPIGIGKVGPARVEAYAEACLRRLATAPEGRRHPTCVAVSCRLLALAKAGLLDPIRVAAMVKGVMVGRGFDGRSGRDLSEIDSILQWAWDTVQPAGLPHVR